MTCFVIPGIQVTPEIEASLAHCHPTKRVKHDIQPDWLTSDILDAMKEKDRFKKNGKIEEYKTLRNKISTIIKESKKSDL